MCILLATGWGTYDDAPSRVWNELVMRDGDVQIDKVINKNATEPREMILPFGQNARPGRNV